MIYVGDKGLKRAFIGSTPVKKIYRGDTLVWPDKYFMVGKTRSNSAAWAFDRLRLYTPTAQTMVMVKDHLGNIVGEQPFSSTLNFEHDFTFDLSGNVNNDEYEIHIKGIPSDALFKQIYAYPTGFGATRNKNAELTYWNLNVANPTNDATTEAYLRLENQPITLIDGANNIKAKHIYIQNSSLPSDQVDALIIGANNSGITGGTFNKTGVTATAASRAAWDSLATKTWTLVGTAPPTA